MYLLIVFAKSGSFEGVEGCRLIAPVAYISCTKGSGVIYSLALPSHADITLGEDVRLVLNQDGSECLVERSFSSDRLYFHALIEDQSLEIKEACYASFLLDKVSTYPDLHSASKALDFLFRYGDQPSEANP